MAYSYKRITVPLSEQEQAQLREAAKRDYRTPRQQARLILLQALGLADPPAQTKNEGRAATLDKSGAPLQASSTTL